MSRDITVGGLGHAYAAEPGELWFAGRVSHGPRGVRGRRVVVRLGDEAAFQLAIELLVIVSARRAQLAEASEVSQG